MQISDRVRELRRVKASELKTNPLNWKVHTHEQQEALRGILSEIGFAGACLARELQDGTLQLIDGHGRAELAGEEEVPVLVIDVDEDEANKLLATLDPIGALAKTDKGKLSRLIESVQTQSGALAVLLSDLSEAKAAVSFQAVDTRPPAPMAWYLIGIATIEADRITEHVEAIGKVPGVFIESVVNNTQPPVRG